MKYIKKVILFIILAAISYYLFIIGRGFYSYRKYNYNTEYNCEVDRLYELFTVSPKNDFTIIEYAWNKRNRNYLLFNDKNEEYLLITYLSYMQTENFFDLKTLPKNEFREETFAVYIVYTYESIPTISTGNIAAKKLNRNLDTILVDGTVLFDGTIDKKNVTYRMINLKFNKIGISSNNKTKIQFLFDDDVKREGSIVFLYLKDKNTYITLLSFARDNHKYSGVFLKDFISSIRE